MSATTAVPTPEQEARAKWDLILADHEYRMEQIRASRQDQYWKPWQVLIPAVTAAVVLIGGVGAGTIWLLHLAGISP